MWKYYSDIYLNQMFPVEYVQRKLTIFLKIILLIKRIFSCFKITIINVSFIQNILLLLFMLNRACAFILKQNNF